jgi:hypothetical protein
MSIHIFFCNIGNIHVMRDYRHIYVYIYIYMYIYIYIHIHIFFCNIGNIHVMRDSYRNLCNILLSPIPIGNDVNFSKQIEDTQWLTHIRLVLKCSHDTAALMRKGIYV